MRGSLQLGLCILAIWRLEAEELRGSKSSNSLTEQRSLQAQAVVAKCVPGYTDVTGGRAYDWACAFHCPGGPYATESCSCACLSPAQLERLERLPTREVPVRGGDVLVTNPPEPTWAPVDPVLKIPIGGLGKPGAELEPPPRNDFVAEVQATTTTSLPETRDSYADLIILILSIVLLSSSAGVVVAAAVWASRKKAMKKARQEKHQQPSSLTLHLPGEKCPQPQGPMDKPAKHEGLEGTSHLRAAGLPHGDMVLQPLDHEGGVTKPSDTNGSCIGDTPDVRVFKPREDRRGSVASFGPSFGTKISRIQPA